MFTAMFIRIFCILLCAGTLQICAFPVPQDSAEVYDINPNAIIEVPKKDDEPLTKAESDENPVSETSTVKSVGQDSAEPILNVNQVSSTSDPIVKAHESDNHEGSSFENDVPKTNASSEGEAVNDSANQEPNDTKTVATDSEDSENSDDPSDRDLTVLSDIYVFGRRMQLVEKYTGSEKILCQFLKRNNEEIIDKECVTVKSPHTILNNEKIINDLNGSGTDIYRCQEIVTLLQGIVQQLCITHDGWIFNPVNVSV